MFISVNLIMLGVPPNCYRPSCVVDRPATSSPQVWSMDRSFHQSFAALSGSFDGSLELWDLRKDEPLQGGLGGADRWIMIFGGLIWLIYG